MLVAFAFQVEIDEGRGAERGAQDIDPVDLMLVSRVVGVLGVHFEASVRNAMNREGEIRVPRVLHEGLGPIFTSKGLHEDSVLDRL